MWRKCLLIGVVWFCSVTLAVSPVLATCVEGDLQGFWHTYTWWTDLGELGWTRCNIIVKLDGSISRRTTCTDSDGLTGNITGGRLTVSPACVVKGNIRVEGLVSKIDHATLNLTDGLISGVGHDEPGGENFAFSAVKK